MGPHERMMREGAAMANAESAARRQSLAEEQARRDAFLLGVISAAAFVAGPHGDDTIAHDILIDHEITLEVLQRLVEPDDDVFATLEPLFANT